MELPSCIVTSTWDSGLREFLQIILMVGHLGNFGGTIGNLPCLYFTVPVLKLHRGTIYAIRALRGFGLCKEGPSLQAFRVGDLLLEAPGAKVCLIELSDVSEVY